MPRQTRARNDAATAGAGHHPPWRTSWTNTEGKRREARSWPPSSPSSRARGTVGHRQRQDPAGRRGAMVGNHRRPRRQDGRQAEGRTGTERHEEKPERELRPQPAQEHDAHPAIAPAGAPETRTPVQAIGQEGDARRKGNDTARDDTDGRPITRATTRTAAEGRPQRLQRRMRNTTVPEIRKPMPPKGSRTPEKPAARRKRRTDREQAGHDRHGKETHTAPMSSGTGAGNTSCPRHPRHVP